MVDGRVPDEQRDRVPTDEAFREWKDANFPEGSRVDQLDEIHVDLALADEWLMATVVPYMEHGVVDRDLAGLNERIAEATRSLDHADPSVVAGDESAAKRYRLYLELMTRVVAEYVQNISDR